MKPTLTLLAVLLLAPLAVMLAATNEAATKKLVTTIDCTKDYGPDAYFGYGDVRVTQSAAGKYREAGPVPESRFGYRFAIAHVGRPHLAVIRYPDDKNRCMAIMDGSSYDLSVGACTGTSKPGGNVYSVDQPISGRMLELRQVFWPRWRDFSIVFGNTKKDEPAAAASVAIYELEDLPALAVPGDPQDGSRRALGIQFEDPCGAAAELGATDRREWIERLITYARYSGQNSLSYPIVWYHGPLYPSQREPVNYIGMTSSKVDRQLIGHWTMQPEDWLTELLKRFGEEHMQFRAVLPVLRLGSLMEKMNIDLASIKAGKDTINNMTFKDQVQMGTYDWTLPYNLRNFQKLVEAGGNRSGSPTFPWAYGERSSGPDGFRGPIFNPLHPTVQDAMLGLVQEVVDRYGRYPAFKGIDFWFNASTTLWFVSLRSGYDDYTVGLFQKETGIVVPVDAKASDRFSRRYAFLTGEVKPKWVAWRCEKIADLFRRIRDVVVRSRPDLQVMIVDALKGHEHSQREGGLDINLLAKEPGIEVSAIWNFNGWVERWGKHRWLPCDPKLRELATIMGKPAEGVMRESLEYPPDGFWWDQQWRITPAFPSGVHFLQPYADALAKYDTLSLRRGGLTLDTGHAELIRPFALAYRALPARKFDTVGAATDPVAVRTLVCDGKRYLYLVNRRHQPVSVEVRLDKATGKATDLATNQETEAPARWPVALGPYQLRSFSLARELEVTGVSIVR
ncbi:MAG: family 10 glycosylhydrolase [Verrucomicrobia bacterium]|nr:family 10 glycosylhydrolase [Verrucomicrobiota bacterium]